MFKRLRLALGPAVNPEDPARNDMRVRPVDNPLNVREDGTIRDGDPAYGFMMEVMQSGRSAIASQREDGTWETRFLD